MTDNNVIAFNRPTYLDLSPDKVLEGAKDRLEGVVIIGYDNAGGEYFASSYASRERMLWLAERLKVRLMAEEDNDTL